MKPPQELAKHLKHAKTDVDENALVKMRTLLGWLAKIITLLPSPSRGINVRRSLDGDVWTVDATGGASRPLFATGSAGSYVFSVALVNGTIEVEIDSVTLGTTPAPVLELSDDGVVMLKLTASLSWNEDGTALDSYSFTTIELVAAETWTEDDTETGIYYIKTQDFENGVVTNQYCYATPMFALQALPTPYNAEIIVQQF